MSNYSFVSVLRNPDNAFGAVETTDFRFEEAACAACDVEYEYKIENNTAKVIVYPSKAPVKYLKLRFRGDMPNISKVYGDQWERCNGDGYPLEWRSVMPHRALAWFCYVKMGDRLACYGVKTGPDCFAFWQVDTHGITLFLNLCSARGGTDLKAPLTACEVVELVGDEGEDEYKVAKHFAKMMCDSPVLPKEPVFGVNNWYWAYGKISRESVLEETDYLMQMCHGTKHRPYMIIDDGWQFNRTYGKNTYIGGPWIASDKFGSMEETAAQIHDKGAKAGIWFRPLLTLGDIPEEATLGYDFGGLILDPTHPYTLERVQNDSANLSRMGYDLIKHDFTTYDMLGDCIFTRRNTVNLCKSDRKFYDKSITTATAIKNLYSTIQKGAGIIDIIGCNTVSHLTAGIHSIYRTGGDISGRSFEWTARNGVNAMMRLPLNDSFYRVDPDCAAFTEKVEASLNLDFLEMCAITGVTTLASVTPGILTDEEMKRINEIYHIADKNICRYGIKNYGGNACPDTFVSSDGANERNFNWGRTYDGSRTNIDWFY